MRALLLIVVGAVVAVNAGGALLLGGCSAPDASARIDPIGPDKTQFHSVAPMLMRRCGSIDCHGSRYRNFRLHGYGGARLEPNARPGTPTRTTDLEADADYDAVIGVEPEIMRDVVQASGAQPERLTLVRKARGSEAHKGGSRITVGDNADKCLLTWLAGAVDLPACEASGCFGDAGVCDR
jgi:hypothetical protein